MIAARMVQFTSHEWRTEKAPRESHGAFGKVL